MYFVQFLMNSKQRMNGDDDDDDDAGILSTQR